MKPTVGRIVHWVEPDFDTGQPGKHRAALVTDVNQDGRPDLRVFRRGNDLSVDAVEQDETANAPATWHWPERE